MIMNLPATYGQAIKPAALRFAQRWFERLNTSGNPWSDAPAMSAATSHAWFADVIRNMLLANTVLYRMWVVAMAKAGVDEAASALRHLVLELRSKRCELPVELEAYEMEVRVRGDDHWPKKPGPSRVDNVMRDLHTAMAVAAVADRFGLTPTQQSVYSVSACAVVAEAMFGATSGGRAYKTVEKIWRRYGAAVPTVPGWSLNWWPAE
jgi:hypothetical protein